MQTTDRGQREAEEAALRMVQDHAAELLRFARRFSHCADDAHDAYQRTLEILVKRMRVDPPAQLLSWVRTVLRNEAHAVRIQREQCLSREEVDLDGHESRDVEDPADRVVGHERLRHAAEALQRLKPQEVTALVLRAEGLSYKEICARTGWTYTRCNRSITEGRRALVDRLAAIESGAECERWLPLLSALADGEASSRELAQLRPHLRACAACRATLRDFHTAPARVAALVPVGMLPAAAPLATEPGSSLLGHVGVTLHAIVERVTAGALRMQGAVEGLTGSGAKVAAVAASTAAIAGGSVAIEQATRTEPQRKPAVALSASATPSLAADGTLTTLAAGLPDLPSPEPDGPSARKRGEFSGGDRSRTPEFGSGPRGGPRARSAQDDVGEPEFAAAGATAAAAPAPAPAPAPSSSSTPPNSAGAPSSAPAPSARPAPEWQAPEFGARP